MTANLGTAAPSYATPAPLNYFTQSFGPAAAPVMTLGAVFTAICVGVCVIVALLLVVAIWRRRQAGGPRDLVRSGDGLTWVYIGAAVSTLVLVGMTLYALAVLGRTASPPAGASPLVITVIGHDWWWEARYRDAGADFVTANEIHIPVGRPVAFNLESADVIHSFWVPLLAGKTQMIPGLMNRQWLQADRPGIYRGQCVQFCGLQHARMSFEVMAESPTDFAKWEQAQNAPAADVSSAGEKIFVQHCAACHAVRGLQEPGTAGGYAPDLTHLMSRRTLAAGTLVNRPDILMEWVTRAQAYKPGVQMPDIPLTDAERTALAAYLVTLK